MRRPPEPRTVLRVERLEDRTAPAALVELAAFASGRVLVTFSDPAADRRAALAAAPFAEAVEPLGFGIYRVELAAGTDVATAAGFYAARPDVAAAAPDRIVRLDRAATDPAAADQWALARIGAAAAWDRQTGTGATVVAVIDSGIDYAHPDLAANVWRNPREVPGNGRDDDGNGFADDVYGANFAANTGDPRDEDGHGTLVAGIVGAVGDNGTGIAGVAWRARIMGLRFLAADGTGYTSDAVRALHYAVANGAKVVNLSWGGPAPDPALATAIGQARAAGVVVVAAAGNDGRDTDAAPFYPAGYAGANDNMVTVAATDRADALAGFSNFGAGVTLAAPGVGVTSTLPNGRYAPQSGTSLAAPFVAGAVALLWDQHPDWSYRQVLDKLKQSVDPVPALAGKVATGGRLNVARMLDAPPPAVPPAAPPAVPPAAPPAPPAAPPSGGGPRVTGFYFAGGSPRTFDKARLTFAGPIDPATLTPEDIALTGPAGPVAVTSVSPVAGSGAARFDVTFAPQTRAGGYTLVVGPDVRDPAGRPMDQDADGRPGEPADDRFTGSDAITGSSAPAAPPPVPPTSPPPAVPPAPPPARAPEGRLTFAAAGPVAIPDRGTAAVTVDVDRDLTVRDLDVRLAVAHTYASDLVIRLTGPDGRSAVLVNRRGGAGEGFEDLALDDQAGAVLVTGRAPFRGAFRPETRLAVFTGVNARGTWTLTAEDVAAKDAGRVDAVVLSIDAAEAAAVNRQSVGAARGPSVAIWDDGRPDVIVPAAAPPPARPESRPPLGWEEPVRPRRTEAAAAPEPAARRPNDVSSRFAEVAEV